jgi:hypothetical protein
MHMHTVTFQASTGALPGAGFDVDADSRTTVVTMFDNSKPQSPGRDPGAPPRAWIRCGAHQNSTAFPSLNLSKTPGGRACDCKG